MEHYRDKDCRGSIFYSIYRINQGFFTIVRSILAIFYLDNEKCQLEGKRIRIENSGGGKQ